MSAADIALEGTTVNIDGKTLRRSHHRSKGVKALQMVIAFASKYGLVLGNAAPKRSPMKSRQYPNSLLCSTSKGCIVSINAVGTQTEIVETIREKEADYLLLVQPTKQRFRTRLKYASPKPSNGRAFSIRHTEASMVETSRLKSAPALVNAVTEGYGRTSRALERPPQYCGGFVPITTYFVVGNTAWASRYCAVKRLKPT